MGTSTKAAGGGRPTMVFAAVFLATYVAARLALEQLGRGTALAVVAATVPVLPFAGLLWHFVRGIRAADELERRIHLEALALAFPLTFLLLMVLGLLDLAVELNPADWSYRHLWPFMVVFWVAGLALARRRYA
jgi:hypothetical protein